MKRLLIKLAAGIGVLLLLFIGIVLYSIMPQLLNMKAEYNTADVIQKVDAFVRDHPGQWPRSWTNLELSNQDDLTTVNFTINPTNATKADVLASIHPPNGRYYTFPHSKRMLENVFIAMTNAMKQAEPTDAAAASRGQ
jgi:hypothetical protein